MRQRAFSILVLIGLSLMLSACGDQSAAPPNSAARALGGVGIALPKNAWFSLQVTTPGFTNRFLRHANSLGFTEIVDANSSATLKVDATFRLVNALDGTPCYSIESLNFPTQYLRHQGGRLRIDSDDGTDGMHRDATFCAQTGLSDAGVSFVSRNFPDHYIRHRGGEVWLDASDGSRGFQQDASWSQVAPWATPSANDASVLPAAHAGHINLRVLNATNGAYSSDQLYWAIIGYDPANNALSHVNASGNLIPANPADNDAANRLTKNGVNYANYFNRVSKAGTITLPKIYGARMFLSLGTPMFIKVLGVPGGAGFAGPDINNPSDPNQDVTFDFTEFTFDDLGFFGNTTRVDQFGFPLRMRLVAGGGYDRTVGDNVSRAQIFADFESIQPTEFRSLVRRPYRIVAPAKGSFGSSGPNRAYFDGYVNQVWEYYRTRDLVFTAEAGTYRGRVTGDDFVFSKDGGTPRLYIRGKPSTQAVLEASGNLASGNSEELLVQAQIAAALNRHLLIDVDSSQWSNSAAYYKSAPANFYAKFWHDRSLDGLAYGFAYDDVRGKSALLQNPQPRQVDFIIGW